MDAASLLKLLQRAWWTVAANHSPLGEFGLGDGWPVLKKSKLDISDPVLVGDRIVVQTKLVKRSESEIMFRQAIFREGRSDSVAEADTSFDCVDQLGQRRAFPESFLNSFGIGKHETPGSVRHVSVGNWSSAVEVHGTGADAVLFIHGFPLDRRMWRHLTSTLTGWKRIAPDLRGMGLTRLPDTQYAIADLADDMVGLLDALGQDRAVVCGLSMGGYVAFEMWRRHSDRITGLILANTKAAADDRAARRGRDETIKLVTQEGPASLADQMIPKLLGTSSLNAMPRVVEHLRNMITETSVDGIVAALKAMKSRSDSTQLLSSIDIPTLVLTGEDDKIVPVGTAKEMAKKIPGAQFVSIAEAGHLTPLEQPIAVSRVIGEFLESLR